jgi:Ala-tRNA(Pro) deacylase
MPVPVAVQTFLANSGQPYVTFHHDRAYTAQEEAAVTHVPGRQWAKTVVCVLDGEPVLAVVPAERIIDIERLRQISGARVARLATEGEFARLYPECEVGAMPPFGPLFHQRVFADRSITRVPEVVFNAGTHVDCVRTSVTAFREMAKPIVAEFTVHV